MTQAHEEPVPRRCPRCGGLMLKPAGSALYWHADNNHPRCDITNLVDAPEVVTPAADEHPDEPPRGRSRKK
jgi:ssDNA-binding Zn-finger/Zn-ribbon topoisomerase 1